MKTHELAQRLNIATSTVRAWTGGEFKRYLSQSAQGDGHRRFFDDTDARILALVVEMKSKSMSPDEIHARLKMLESAGWVDLPELPAAPPGTKPVELMPREAATSRIEEQRRGYLTEIARLQDRVEDLTEELRAERVERAEERQRLQNELSETRQRLGEATGKLSTLEGTAGQAERLQAELSQAQAQAGELRGRLDMVQAERRPAAFWLAVTGTLVALAVIVTVVLLSLPGR